MKFSPLLVLFSIFAGCGVNEKVKHASDTMREMNDSTNHMEQSTDQMGQTMGQMNQKMDETNSTMGDMKDQMTDMKEDMVHLGADARQSIALLTRLEAQKTMNAATAIEAKLAAAAQYFMAFEFQVWKGTRIDTEARRDELFASAIAEFFRTQAGAVAKHGFETSPTSDDNEVNNLYALAATLHYLNPNQELFLEESGQKTITMLDLIKQTIIVHDQLKSGKLQISELNAWQKEGLYWYDHAVYFLRLRAQFLAAMAINRLADLDAAREGGKMKELWAKGKLALFRWDAKWDNFKDNPAWIDQISRYADASNATTRFLSRQGIANPVSPLFKKVVAHMNVKNAAYTQLEEAVSAQQGLLAQATERLLDMQELLTGETP